MQKAWWIGVFLSVLTGVFSGCKKNTDRKIVCRIGRCQSLKDNVTRELSYDSQGRLSVVSSFNEAFTYEYPDHQTIINHYTVGVLSTRTTVIKNNAGLAVNVHVENVLAGGSWTNDANEYDGDRIIRKTQSYSDPRLSQLTTYQWDGGNLRSSVTNGDTTFYSYFEESPSQMGDYFYLLQLIGGYDVFRVKNLLKGIGDHGYFYTFGPDEKVAVLGETAGGRDLSDIQLHYDYQYE